MSVKITVVSIDGVLVEGAVRKTTPSGAAALVRERIADVMWNTRRRTCSIDEVRLLKEGTTAGTPMRGVSARDRFWTIAAAGSIAALMAILAFVVY